MSINENVTPRPKAKPRPKRRHRGRARPDEPLAFACALQLDGCEVRASTRHHVLRRSRGGTDEATNTLDVCLQCHTWIHDHPAESYRRGWLKKGNA